MKLTIKNIGKIKDASVEIKGITVIAGENDTGKSTVGKALFSSFNSFYNINSQIKVERIESIQKVLDIMYRNVTERLTRRFDTYEVAQELYRDYMLSQGKTLRKEELLSLIIQYDEFFEKYEENSQLEGTVARINDILNVSDLEFFKRVLEKKLDAEFNSQICNIYESGVSEIILDIRNQPIRIRIDKNRVLDIDGTVDLRTEAVYLDDPFVLDEVKSIFLRLGIGGLDHRTHLREKLYFAPKENNVIEEIIVNNKLENIYGIISSICDGEIVRTKQTRLGYKKPHTEAVLEIKNLSTGLKTFLIIKMLLENGAIETNGTIILDEPEIHLHPEWQLVLAELIILIHCEFGIHVLINTHSPYFLNAIEVYSAKYGIAEKNKYYLTSDNGRTTTICDVTNNVESIYSKLARPLQKLENESYKYD